MGDAYRVPVPDPPGRPTWGQYMLIGMANSVYYTQPAFVETGWHQADSVWLCDYFYRPWT